MLKHCGQIGVGSIELSLPHGSAATCCFEPSLLNCREAAHGGLSAAIRRKLAGLQNAAPSGEVRPAPALQLKAGAVLMREWQGRHHTVTVLEDGFEYNGQRHRTLSAIAQIITGSHWSGPRFFGLARRPKPFEHWPGIKDQLVGAAHV